MFKVPSSARPALRILAIAVSTGLFAYLVWHAGPEFQKGIAMPFCSLSYDSRRDPQRCSRL